MHEYIIIGETLREAMYCYDYMCRLFPDKIVRANKCHRVIIVDEYILRFTSDELYFRSGCRGNRTPVIGSRYVERLLDTYKVLAGK